MMINYTSSPENFLANINSVKDNSNNLNNEFTASLITLYQLMNNMVNLVEEKIFLLNQDIATFNNHANHLFDSTVLDNSIPVAIGSDLISTKNIIFDNSEITCNIEEIHKLKEVINNSYEENIDSLNNLSDSLYLVLF